MKRYSLILLALALLLCASAAFAIFPGQQYGLQYPAAVGDGYETFKMQLGWADGYQAWYICTDTNDIRWAQWYDLTLAPKLSGAQVGQGAAIMLWVTNPPQSQGPIFQYPPTSPGYTPIWVVYNVSWLPNATKVPITSFAQAVALQGAAQITITPTTTRVDCSILATYQLGGPFLVKPLPFYRIPQGRIIGTGNTRFIQLPYWNVYCQDPITRRISVRRVIIPDVYPQSLAKLIGANYAPAMLQFFNSYRNLMYVINWAQDFDANLPGIQPLKVRIDQYPVLCNCPTGCAEANTNYNYSPVATFQLLNRLFPTPPGSPVPAETLYTTCPFIQTQINNGNLIPVTYPTPPILPMPVNRVGVPIPFVVNAPVLCNFQ